MTAIEHADIIWLAAVTVLTGCQMATFSIAVGKARQKHKIEPPKTDGPDEFVRVFRAQQNSVEFFPLVVSLMWMAGLFFHQVPAALAGLLYSYGRDKYFKGYCMEAKLRVPGVRICGQAVGILLTLSITGCLNYLLLMYTNINLKAVLFGLFK